MRDAFAVLFFVSVGMLFEPASLVKAPGLLASPGARDDRKPLIASLHHLPRYPCRIGLGVAASSAIGEFLVLIASSASGCIFSATRWNG